MGGEAIARWWRCLASLWGDGRCMPTPDLPPSSAGALGSLPSFGTPLRTLRVGLRLPAKGRAEVGFQVLGLWDSGTGLCRLYCRECRHSFAVALSCVSYCTPYGRCAPLFLGAGFRSGSSNRWRPIPSTLWPVRRPLARHPLTVAGLGPCLVASSAAVSRPLLRSRS